MLPSSPVALSLTPAPSDLYPGCRLQAPTSYLSLTFPFHPVETFFRPRPFPGPGGCSCLPVCSEFPLLFVCLACLFLTKDAEKGREKRWVALFREIPEGRDWVSPSEWGLPEGSGCRAHLSWVPCLALVLQHFPAPQEDREVTVLAQRLDQGGATSPFWPSL